LIALVRTPDIGAIEPGEMYLRVTKAMVRIMLFGAGAAVVLDFFSHSWLRRLCWDIMLVFVLATPLANLDFMRERYAFNAGFELLQEIRRDAAGTGSKCALLVDVPDIELGVVNPGASVPGMRIVDCDNPAVCLKEAEAGGCLYYFRNSWCYYGATCVEADSAKDRPALKSACSELESSLKLEKIREMEVDFKKSYPGLACDSMPRAGVLGAYRVVSVRR
jgi:hypothetical protein